MEAKRDAMFVYEPINFHRRACRAPLCAIAQANPVATGGKDVTPDVLEITGAYEKEIGVASARAVPTCRLPMWLISGLAVGFGPKMVVEALKSHSRSTTGNRGLEDILSRNVMERILPVRPRGQPWKRRCSSLRPRLSPKTHDQRAKQPGEWFLKGAPSMILV